MVGMQSDKNPWNFTWAEITGEGLCRSFMSSSWESMMPSHNSATGETPKRCYNLQSLLLHYSRFHIYRPKFWKYTYSLLRRSRNLEPSNCKVSNVRASRQIRLRQENLSLLAGATVPDSRVWSSPKVRLQVQILNLGPSIWKQLYRHPPANDTPLSNDTLL